MPKNYHSNNGPVAILNAKRGVYGPKSSPLTSGFREPCPQKIGNYVTLQILGEGTFGKVLLASDPLTGEKVAIKVVDRLAISSPRERKNILREVRLMKLLYHPHIIHVLDIVESKEKIMLIMEHASGGELHDYVMQRNGLSESESRHFFRQTISAVDYLHQNSIVHRDLKPENLLIDSKGNVKLIDFGFGNTFHHKTFLNTFCGSPFYAAPEMTQGVEYVGPEVDVWSLGVILYILLTGALPFQGNDIAQLYESIGSGSYTIPQALSNSNVLEVLAGMLHVDPKHRWTLQQIKHHPWVNEGYSDPVMNFLPARNPIGPTSVLNMGACLELKSLGYASSDIQGITKDWGLSPLKSLYYLHEEWLRRKKHAQLSIQHDSKPWNSPSTMTSFNASLSCSKSSDYETGVRKPFDHTSKLKHAQHKSSTSKIASSTKGILHKIKSWFPVQRHNTVGMTKKLPTLNVQATDTEKVHCSSFSSSQQVASDTPAPISLRNSHSEIPKPPVTKVIVQRSPLLVISDLEKFAALSCGGGGGSFALDRNETNDSYMITLELASCSSHPRIKVHLTLTLLMLSKGVHATCIEYSLDPLQADYCCDSVNQPPFLIEEFISYIRKL